MTAPFPSPFPREYRAESFEGLPYIGHKQRGDMLVEIRVVTPTKLTPKQIELLKAFDEAGKESPLSQVKDKIKQTVDKAKKAMNL